MQDKDKYQWVLDEYPAVITKEQLYKICHVSKKTALYYLESKFIPCECSGKKTRKYKIKTKDVVRFLKMRDESPEKFRASIGWYKQRNGVYTRNITPYMRKRLRVALQTILENYPDVLSAAEVSEITGYVTSTVDLWCSSGRIHHFCIQGRNRIPKTSLLEFLTSNDYRAIRVKSRKHILLMEKAQQY